MAILRCNKCAHIQEVNDEYIDKKAKCPKCQHVITIYNTVSFLKSVIQKYYDQNQKFNELEEKLLKLENLNQNVIENNPIEDIDIYDTKVLTHSDRYYPIIEWFQNRDIKVQINKDEIDTTGFFDEAALFIGKNYDTLKDVISQIKYIQSKSFDTVKVSLSQKSNKEINTLLSFCKEMHKYSFIARYNQDKKTQAIYITVQNIPKVKSFFNGIWMEWYSLMLILEFLYDKKIESSSMRSLQIEFKDKTKNEIDIFFLTRNNIPIYIECKSGEFRQDIDKYLKLRKKLNIDKKYFIVCVFGLEDKQAQGMNSMYDLTFVNEKNLVEHVSEIMLAG